MLEGHAGDNIGDGTPKLPWQAYCDALDAIARCTSVGRHRGTRARPLNFSSGRFHFPVFRAINRAPKVCCRKAHTPAHRGGIASLDS